jgi:hypothetical protein
MYMDYLMFNSTLCYDNVDGYDFFNCYFYIKYVDSLGDDFLISQK